MKKWELGQLNKMRNINNKMMNIKKIQIEDDSSMTLSIENNNGTKFNTDISKIIENKHGDNLIDYGLQCDLHLGGDGYKIEGDKIVVEYFIFGKVDIECGKIYFNENGVFLKLEFETNDS